jgi:precorrin-2 dehydrogenase/sirohydrochlorin ferrochelatase
MGYYPIFLELNERRCLVIGGGLVAERKVAALVQAGARVTVISPELTANLVDWSQQASIHAIGRPYRRGDLAGYEIVFVATDDPQVNAAVYEEGKSRGVWCNAADDPAHCDFILPSVLRRGALTVAVSTGAASPALARLVREELESYFSRDYEIVAELAAEVREELRARGIAPGYEKWRQALTGELKQWVTRGERRQAKNFLLKELGVTL